MAAPARGPYNLALSPASPSPPSSSLSPVPPPQLRTCTLCRQRRIKCDRQMPRCSNCHWADATCVYPPGRGRAPKKPRRGVPPQLSERLARLESIINQVSVAQNRHGSQEYPHTPAAGDGVDLFDQHFSRLKVDESRSYYVNNALWVTLSSEVSLESLSMVGCWPASRALYLCNGIRLRNFVTCCLNLRARMPPTTSKQQHLRRSPRNLRSTSLPLLRLLPLVQDSALPSLDTELSPPPFSISTPLFLRL